MTTAKTWLCGSLLLLALLAACSSPTAAPPASTQVAVVPTVAPTQPPAPPTTAPTVAPTPRPPTAVPPTTVPPTTAPTTQAQAKDDPRMAQLQRLQKLLQDQNFALEMAQTLDAAYYKGQNQPVPPFLKPEEETATAPKSVKEEKIAINLAGFYAVECGVGVLAERGKETPFDILDSIAKGTRSKDDMLLIARFANATWKAGQPFRALNRITRDNFRPAALLSQEDLQKDFDQIKAAAGKLTEKMQDVRSQPAAEQLKRLQALLQDQAFALEMAQTLDAAYYKGQNQPVPPFLKPEEETATAPKSVKEEKIAINLAGFYAVESGLGVISERTKEMPMDILDSIAKGTRSKDDMLLIARFANATWKAGQPFRALNRITRDNFRPAALLSEDDLKKDFDQIKAAADKLLEAMKRP